jgi:hypothetical protein
VQQRPYYLSSSRNHGRHPTGNDRANSVYRRGTQKRLKVVSKAFAAASHFREPDGQQVTDHEGATIEVLPSEAELYAAPS